MDTTEWSPEERCVRTETGSQTRMTQQTYNYLPNYNLQLHIYLSILFSIRFIDYNQQNMT